MSVCVRGNNNFVVRRSDLLIGRFSGYRYWGKDELLDDINELRKYSGYVDLRS